MYSNKNCLASDVARSVSDFDSRTSNEGSSEDLAVARKTLAKRLVTGCIVVLSLVMFGSNRVLGAKLVFQQTKDQSGRLFESLGVPAINRNAASPGTYHLAVEHNGSTGKAPSGVYVGWSSGPLLGPATSPLGATRQPSIGSVGSLGQLPVYLEGTSTLVPDFGTRVSTHGAPLTGSGNYGKPSADGNRIAFVELDLSGSQFKWNVRESINGGPSAVVYSGTNQLGDPYTGAISLRNANASMFQFGSTPADTGIYRLDMSNPSAPGSFTKIVDSTSINPVTAQAFNFNVNNAPLPASRGLGAVWSTIDGVFYSQPNFQTIRPNDPYVKIAERVGYSVIYGEDVSAGQNGVTVFERSMNAGTPQQKQQIAASLWGKIVSLVTTGDTLGGERIFGLNMGNEAVATVGRPSGSGSHMTANFVAFSASVDNHPFHPQSGTFVLEIEDQGVDLSGRWTATQLSPSASLSISTCVPGVSCFGSPGNDSVHLLSVNSDGSSSTLTQTLGSTFGADSGMGDNPQLFDHFVNQSGGTVYEGISLSFDKDVHLDELHPTDLAVGETLRFKYSGKEWDVLYNGPTINAEYADGIQAIDMNDLFMPAGSKLTVEYSGNQGSGVDGFGLDSILYHVSDDHYLPGDFNADGFVDYGDLLVWKSNYGSQVAPYSEGDANGNGLVDGKDFLAWQTNFGIAATAFAATTVPEPTTFALAALCSLGHILCLRRR